jgi:hypothetical protein
MIGSKAPVPYRTTSITLFIVKISAGVTLETGKTRHQGQSRGQTFSALSVSIHEISSIYFKNFQLRKFVKNVCPRTRLVLHNIDTCVAKPKYLGFGMEKKYREKNIQKSRKNTRKATSKRKTRRIHQLSWAKDSANERDKRDETNFV